MARTRDTTIDALKGFAVLLVILGHSIYDVAWLDGAAPGAVQIVSGAWVPLATATNPLLSFAYSFHTPLLAMVSGFVLWRPAPEAWGVQLKKRVLGLLVPYLSWAVVYYVVKLAIGLDSRAPVEAALDSLVSVATTGTLWYLYALFICSVAVIPLQRARYGRVILAVTAAGAIAVSQLPPARTSTLAVNETLWIYPFFVVGYLMAAHKENLRLQKARIAAGFGLLFVGLAVLQYPIPVPQEAAVGQLDALLDSVGVPGTFTLVRYAAGFAGAIACFGLFYMLPPRVLAPFASLGRRTLGLFAASEPVNAVLVVVGLSSWPVLFVASVLVSLAVTIGLEKVPVARLLLLGRAEGRLRVPPA